MPDSKLSRLMARLNVLEGKQEHTELFHIRCAECGLWPWQIRFITDLSQACQGCHRLQQRYPNPLGDDRMVTFVLLPKDGQQ
jgi:hypothetical protein